MHPMFDCNDYGYYITADQIYKGLVATTDISNGTKADGDGDSTIHFFNFDLEAAMKTHAEIKPVRMWQTPNGYTTVEWSDGTKTTVKAEDEGKATPMSGFAIAYAKKMFGSTTKLEKAMQEAIDRANEKAKARKEKAEAEKQRKKELAESDKAFREDRIRMEMEKIYIQREARKRVVLKDMEEETRRSVDDDGDGNKNS